MNYPRQVFVLEPESHHHVLEAVVYERHWSHVEHRFYLRPRGSKHKILSVAFSDVDPFSLGQEAMTTDLQVHSEVIRPHTLTEIWGAELMIQTYTDWFPPAVQKCLYRHLALNAAKWRATTHPCFFKSVGWQK